MQPSRPFAFVVACVLAFAIGPRAARAELVESPCRLVQGSLPAAFGRCAGLAVPLDYAAADGPSLTLFVARIPALTATPAADPLVLINGGPGGSAVDLYLQARPAFEPIRRSRDIVLLDQRGTGRSLAGLDCGLDEDFELFTSGTDEIRATVGACIGEFEHDPRFFTTSVAVRDLDALRAALGVEQWNIYGVSYGTRVAQHYLRRYDAHVRSLILDGVVPPDLALGPNIAADAARTLAAVFARCLADASCGARFPDLPRQFAALQDRLGSASIVVATADPASGEPTSLELDESHLQTVVRLMSYSDATVALLPLIIDAAYNGHYAPLAAAAELQIAALEETLGFAMHNSVVCTEDAPWFPSEPAPGSERLYLGSTVVDGLGAICDAWPAGIIDPDFKETVTSAKPVLLLSGEHDPVTPPANAEHVVAGGLENSRHLVGRAQGHGIAAVGCVPRLLGEFVDTADPAALDASCLTREPPMPFFLSFQGPAP